MPSIIFLTRDDIGHEEYGGYVIDASIESINEDLGRCIDTGDCLAYFRLHADDGEIAVNPRQVVAVEDYE